MLPTVSAEERWEERRAERGSPLRQRGGMVLRDLQIWRHEQSFRELISLVQILFGPALAAGRSRLHAHYLFDTGIVVINYHCMNPFINGATVFHYHCDISSLNMLRAQHVSFSTCFLRNMLLDQ